MGFEQRNNEALAEINDSEISNSEVKNQIEKSLNTLGQINPNNDNFALLKDKINLYQDNKEALLIINNGLKNIIEKTKDIANQGKKDIYDINKTILRNLEQLEREKDLYIDDLDLNGEDFFS